MRQALLAFALLGTMALALPSRAEAQTEYDRALQLYDQGTKPALTELSTAAGWAGRTVTPSGGVYGGAFLIYPQEVDGTGPYGVERAVPGPDTVVQMTADEMQSYYDDQEDQIYRSAYSPIIDAGDPLNPGLSYTSVNGAVSYGIRKAVGEGGVPVYLISGTCEVVSGCREVGTNRPVGLGGALGIIYVWENKLAPAAP